VLGQGHDTSDLVFPHRTLSLSHADGRAVAVRGDGSLGGVGIDFEPWRPEVNTGIARFFLRRSEQAATEVGAHALLRLWTVKEALFKATPDNGAIVLLDFELTDPAAASGEVVGPRGEAMRYAGIDVEVGHLAVAVCMTRQHAAV